MIPKFSIGDRVLVDCEFKLDPTADGPGTVQGVFQLACQPTMYAVKMDVEATRIPGARLRHEAELLPLDSPVAIPGKTMVEA